MGGDVTACPRRLVGLTQEHGQVEAIDGRLDFQRFPLGSILVLIPFHVSTRPATPCHARPRPAQHPLPIPQACATAAMHPVYYVHAEGKVVELWHPVRGW